MGYKATSVEEQIQLLKSRGLTIDLEEQKVKEVLLDIGYYRLGFYWNPFEEATNHKFKNGALFSDALQLYYIDAAFRKVFLTYLYRIEVNFKTKLIYYVSNQYPKSPTWFADLEIMNKQFVVSLSKVYDEQFKTVNKVIRNHHKKHINDIYAPAWKTIEYFSFGTALRIYRGLKDHKLRVKISDKYGVRSIKKFVNHITAILFIRNVCSHGGVLFDLKSPKGIACLPGLPLEGEDRHSMGSLIKLVAFYLGKISEKRSKDFEQEVKNILLEREVSDNNKRVIETKMGIKFV